MDSLVKAERDRSTGSDLLDEIESLEHGIAHQIREGRFQRGLALIAGLSSLIAGLEVSYEHYRGSYSNPVMYTPVVLSGALFVSGISAAANRRAARTILPAVSAVTLADCLIGFGFHVRGIQRKPGGWRLPVFNVIMGPPIFAPLLFGTSAYLGLVASFLRREGSSQEAQQLPAPAWSKLLPRKLDRHEVTVVQELREGRFQRHLAVATAAAAFFSGIEALYSHYKNNFKYKAQWSPIMIAAILVGTALGAVKSPRVAKKLLPTVSALAIADGAAGFYYHARGVARRPGGLKHPVYNIMFGPPIFAPLLFAACGFLGLLASMFRRER
ncbi:MAG TPA: hypothetical protein VNE63_00700 [Candidatus Acidoferrales bacterium]|nr:hypothetical protein [Candidatus Acidoferrales bacterium]